MKKTYRCIGLASISSLLLLCSSLSMAQYTNDQSNTITINSETLWYKYFGIWETQLAGILHTDNAGLQNFFQYCSPELNKDKGSFFTEFSTRIIFLDSTSQFFDSLDNKYIGLYKQYIALGGNSSSVSNSPALPDGASRSSCNPACSNIGFQNGTLSYWSAFWAVDASTVATIKTADVTGGPCASVTQAAQDPNTKTYQVSLMPSTGTDPLAGPLIPYAPPLGGACALVGDGPTSGAGVGMLEQSFTVSASNPLLTLQYAVMLENPNHPGYQQPWFQIQVLDENGNEIPGCGQYFVVSGPSATGFIPLGNPSSGDTVYCKPWTTAFVPLNNYIGQCVTVIFTASDCALGGHYGYAYVAASCSQISLSSSSTVFCKGQRSATITGPPGGAIYQWTTTDGCIPGSSTQQVVQVTCAGTYRLVTSSFAGTECVDTFSIIIPASAAGPPVPCFTVGDTICSGDSFHVDASCSITNTGTKYYWDFYDNGQYEDSSGTNPQWTYIAGGNYNIRLHEVAANGCSADTVIRTVVESTANFGTPDITFTSTNASSCGKCDGELTMSVVIASLTVGITITTSFDNSVMIFSKNSQSISANGACQRLIGGFGGPKFTYSPCADTCPGTYYYYIRPTATVPPTRCAPGGFIGDTIPVTIGVIGVNLAISQTIVPATCGKNNGSASISVSGGTAPYTYAWPATLGNDSSVAGLKAGNYMVTVTDAGGCNKSFAVIIDSLNNLSTVAVPYYVSCFGANNGAIKIQPVSGNSPYTYHWLPNVSNTDSAGGLTPGNYSVTVTDAAGCSGTVAAQIIQPAKITDAITGNYANVPCHNAGYAIVTATGGYPPYTFNWSNGANLATDTGLTTGVYTLTITDANQCRMTDRISVEVGSTGQIMSPGSDSICQGTSKVLTVPGVSMAVQWQSSTTGSSFSDIPGATAASYTSTPSQTTYFRVYSPNDTSSCPDTSAVFKLLLNPSPAPALTAANDSICSGDSTQVCTADTFASYLWNTGSTSYCTTANAAGGYWVTVTAPDGCSNESAHKNIYVYPVSSVSIIVQGDTLSSFGAVSYQWLLNGLSISNATAATYIARTGGSYSVAVTDTNGCTTTSSAVAVTGIEDLAKEGVSLFPNPSTGSWQLGVDNALIGSDLEIYDDNGRIVSHSIIRNPKSEISLNVSKGIYWLRISNANVNVVRKLVRL